MRKWLGEFFEELDFIRARLFRIMAGPKDNDEPRDEKIYKWGVRVAIAALVLVLVYVAMNRPNMDVDRPDAPKLDPVVVIDYTVPVRPEPKRFKMNTTLPSIGEGKASMSIGEYPFDPETDLLSIDDRRVWWESEHDSGDTEDDHLMHFALEHPFRRLVELVEQAGGKLKVQDAYRDAGVHAVKSLHKEGRALDLTSEVISLEKLSKLCWAAGFDWVFYEAPKKGGHHVHVSVRPIAELDK